jgi:hypothetical protein
VVLLRPRHGQQLLQGKEAHTSWSILRRVLVLVLMLVPLFQITLAVAGAKPPNPPSSG